MNEEVKTIFPSSWSLMFYADAVNGISTNKKKINQKKYLTSGTYPIFDQGNNYIGGYTDDSDKIIYCDFPVIIFGDHTRAVKMAKEPFSTGADGVKVLQPKKFISPKLLKYFTDYLAISIKDKGYARHYQWVAKENIGIPPENEQHRIEAKIEELFSELDKGIESLKTAREQLKVYRQALLKQAFEGKITEQWRKDNADAVQGSASVAGGQEARVTKLETADQLLERIKQEREARYQQQLKEWKYTVKQWETDGKEGKKPTKPRAFQVPEELTDEEVESLAQLPQGVCWVKVGNIFDVFVGATPSRKNEKYWDGDIPWVSSGEVAFCTIKDTKEKISRDGYANASTVVHPVGTVMLAMIGEGKTRGQAAILNIEAAHNQNTAAIRVSETSCSTSLFYYYLLYQYELTRLLGSGNNQKALNKVRVSNMTYPLFSIDEQEQISMVIDEKLSALEGIESDISLSLMKSEALRQSILKKAFSGQLVHQDPDDEPASVILDLIAKEKEEAAAKLQKAKATKKKPKTNRAATRKAS